MNVTAKKVGIVLMILAAFFAIFLYAYFDPETTPFPKCPFYWATGLKCPGCGSQRALHQLLHLRIGAAFQYNACLVLLIPILLFLLVAEKLRARFPKLYSVSRNPVFFLVYAGHHLPVVDPAQLLWLVRPELSRYK
jgi:hypothetical protein